MADGETTVHEPREAARTLERVAAEWAPRSFGERYTHRGELGRGGMGEVALTHDAVLGREVALKTIREDRLDRGDVADRFARETELQGRLQHPSIVPVYDAGLDETGRPFFTMRRVAGTSLAERIESSREGLRELLDALRRVALAVEYAHQRGVLHCDLKPSNVMLGEFGEVYVLDWGCAREWTDAGVAAARGVAGSPSYMAPEQAAGRDHLLGPATDVFALGAILFELLTGRPFAEVRQDDDARGGALEGQPPELATLCLRATAHDVERRMHGARAFHEALQVYLDGELDARRRREDARRDMELARRGLEELAGASEELAVRSEVIRAIGRAVSLEPDNPDALPTLRALIDAPMREEPGQVELDTRNAARERIRRLSRVAMLAYLSQLVSAPVFLFLEVRQPLYLWAFYLAMAASAALAWWTHRSPSQANIGLCLVVSTLGTTAFVGLCGSLLLMPMIVIVNISAYAIVFPRKPFVPIGAGALALLLPWLLERAHMVGEPYGYADGALHIAARAVGLDVGIEGFLVVANLVTLASGCVVSWFFAVRIRAAERQVFSQAWHYQQLLPSSE